jgi:protein-arginine kinase activator protein McsA
MARQRRYLGYKLKKKKLIKLMDSTRSTVHIGKIHNFFKKTKLISKELIEKNTTLKKVLKK